MTSRRLRCGEAVPGNPQPPRGLPPPLLLPRCRAEPRPRAPAAASGHRAFPAPLLLLPLRAAVGPRRRRLSIPGTIAAPRTERRVPAGGSAVFGAALLPPLRFAREQRWARRETAAVRLPQVCAVRCVQCVWGPLWQRSDAQPFPIGFHFGSGLLSAARSWESCVCGSSGVVGFHSLSSGLFSARGWELGWGRWVCWESGCVQYRSSALCHGGAGSGWPGGIRWGVCVWPWGGLSPSVLGVQSWGCSWGGSSGERMG